MKVCFRLKYLQRYQAYPHCSLVLSLFSASPPLFYTPKKQQTT
nr:MAG TPA: hypothetical protein [Caudoviricetes sp.]